MNYQVLQKRNDRRRKLHKQRVTIKDIATQLNISSGTVDRAINEKGRISEQTKKLIMQKIEELGYKPNRIARALGKNELTTLAFIAPSQNPFWEAIMQGATIACNELIDYNVHLKFYSQKSDFDSMNQIKEVERIIDEKPKGIIIAPLHPYLLSTTINKAIENCIPVVTVNLDSKDSNRLCYVGEDPFSTGAIVGELFKKFIGREGDIAVLTGNDAFSQFHVRKEGFLNAFMSDSSKINIIGYYEYADSEDLAYEISKKLILEVQGLKGIFANTTTGAIGIAKAIRDLNKNGSIVAICYDTSDEIKELLDCNAFFTTVIQNPFLQGYYAVKLLYKIILEKTTPENEFNYVRTDIIVNSKQLELNNQALNYNMFI